MTDSSDCESDAGASPSVSSEDSDGSSSSRCSSPMGLKIVTPSCANVAPPVPATPRRKNSTLVGQSSSALVNTPETSFLSNASSLGLCSTPLSSVRKPARRRQLITPPDTPMTSLSVVSKPSESPSPRGTLSDHTITSPASSAGVGPQRKRKRVSPANYKAVTSEKPTAEVEESKLPSCSPEKKRKRNKRRRTRSERNLLSGKTNTVVGSTQVVNEGEEVVALDAEIDRVLEEKALKSNLTAKNVKSIIHHVMTDNLVQKMFMSVVKRKVDQPTEGDGESSDEFGLVEPKMTRAKTKELMGSNKKILWPIVDSPVKLSKQPVSETHMLIHNDLPEDSSGDEEYIPKGTTPLSDDESSSVASSRNSDFGSPASKPGVMTRRSVQSANSSSPFNDSMFKTPPPKQKPKALRKKDGESAISLRTRSKLPLNDTPLEDLERQLIPPDITKDMYDWGTDNEDYLAFLKDFLNPGQNQNDANEQDDDAADPEYNVMEDFEDEHDREELRMDRAVKVPKKELTQLIAELFEAGGILSGDDMEDHDLATLTGITPLVNDSGYTAASEDTTLNNTVQAGGNTTVNTSQIVEETHLPPPVAIQNYHGSQVVNNNDEIENNLVNVIKVKEDETTWTRKRSEHAISGQRAVSSVEGEEVFTAQNEEIIDQQPPYFLETDLKRLHHQIRQHLQLLAQSYVMTVSSEDTHLKTIAKSTKTMVIEVKNFARMYGDCSNFAVCNLDAAWTLVNLWPHKILNQSPIKKKILEEQYISESGISKNGTKKKDNYFPRHVVKVIAESPAFLYNDLLPECYNQKHVSTRCRFSYSEDCLLVGGLEDLKELKLSVSQVAEVISEVLLVVHPNSQVYHRIRNLKKTSNGGGGDCCRSDIKRYFSTGQLPEIDRTVPELREQDKLPLLQRDRRGLTQQWTALLNLIEDSPRGMWEERLSKNPVTKSIGKKMSRQMGKKKDGALCTGPQFTQSETINRVFPNGTLMVDTPNPNMKLIPVIGANGKVGAVIHIPRLALVAPPSQHPSNKEETRTTVGELPDSPNVILEGTEVELTEDEDDSLDVDLRCNEEPEMVTLSSDDDEVNVVKTPVLTLVNNNESGANSPPKKSDSGNGGDSKSQGPTNSAQSSSLVQSTSGIARKVPSRGKGDDSDEDGDNKRPNINNKKRVLPKDYNGDDEQQEKDKHKRSMQAPPAPPAAPVTGLQSATQQQQSQLPHIIPSQTQKKAKRSPGGQGGGKSRVTSKYHVTPPEKLVEETPSEFEDVADAYMEAYLARVQSATEATHPGVYSSFVQMLIDAGEGSAVNQGELYSKVKLLFKEYPDLLREFESFLDPSLTRNNIDDSGSNDATRAAREDTLIEIQLIQMVEKYTENCPALKAKIMNKLKSLKEKPNLTENDMASALEPFFFGNPVMMMAFKQLLPSVYRPQTLTSDQFEVMELEIDDPSPHRGGDANANADLHYEIVKLPDEKQVVATNTCPCVCHTRTSDPAFASRSKHCRKCALKFQDGKIFIHNGRVMRPVSVELTSTKQQQTCGNLSNSNIPPSRSTVTNIEP